MRRNDRKGQSHTHNEESVGGPFHIAVECLLLPPFPFTSLHTSSNYAFHVSLDLSFLELYCLLRSIELTAVNPILRSLWGRLLLAFLILWFFKSLHRPSETEIRFFQFPIFEKSFFAAADEDDGTSKEFMDLQSSAGKLSPY